MNEFGTLTISLIIIILDNRTRKPAGARKTAQIVRDITYEDAVQLVRAHAAAVKVNGSDDYDYDWRAHSHTINPRG